MDLSQLRQGDRVAVVATIVKIDAGGEGGVPAVLVSLPNAFAGIPGNPDTISVLVPASSVARVMGRAAAPAQEAYPLGTLARTREELRGG